MSARVKNTDLSVELSNLLRRKPVGEYGKSFPLIFYNELPFDDRITGKTSSQLTNFELKMRMLRDGEELFRRAYSNDTDAARDLVVLARNLTNELNLFAERKHSLINDIAKSYDEWPVVLSLIDKNKDAETWQQFFKNTLRLGEDSFCCTNRRQKVDLTNIWNRYVWFALKAMRLNKDVIPILREKCKSLPAIQMTVLVGRTSLRTRFYELQNQTVVISEWANLCCALPDRLTSEGATIKRFMKLLKLAVLEYWVDNPKDYAEAVSKVRLSDKYKSDSSCRALCFTQMEQHLRTLAGK